MNEEQFEKLISQLSTINTTLSSDPLFNPESLSSWAILISACLALAAFILALAANRIARSSLGIEALQAKLVDDQSVANSVQRDADFIFSSYKEYVELYDDLLLTRSLHEKYRDAFLEMDSIVPDLESAQNVHKLVSDEEWAPVRRVKRYYKSRIQLVSNGYISEKAVFIAIDTMGLDLLGKELKRIDKQIFLQNRKDSIERGDTDGNEITQEFERVFSWYNAAESLKENYQGAYGYN